MSDSQRTDRNLPRIDLTNNNATGNNHSDLTGSDDRGANHSPEIVDLTDANNQYFASSIPVIDLTSDNNQVLNYRIPVIDLTDDDAQIIADQTQCIDLTYNDTSINSTIQNFNLGQIGDKEINLCTKLIDLTDDDIQDIDPNTPVIDIMCDNNQFLNYKIEDIDMTSDDVQDITHGLQHFDITDGKQQNINDCSTTNDFTNHSYQNINRIITGPDLISNKDYNNVRRPIIDLVRNDHRVVRKPVDDVEMHDLSYNSPSSFQKPVIENNFRIPDANRSYNTNENNSLKFNETSNMNEMYIGTLSTSQKFNRRREILENHPLKDNFEDRIETILTNRPPRNNSEEEYLIPGRSDKISQNNKSDFLKPAHQPIPLRHSLGRSTVNTSKNTPIECTEIFEGQSHTLTASSIIRRKKSNSIGGISEHIPTKSKNLSVSEENTFYVESFKRFFRKYWIFLLLTFIGLYYLISMLDFKNDKTNKKS
ncbi:unnamed protein product [Larinioides sclopetarius]|uniref:Uncharacterized protein n=1 Tax=Larinioides sclopetarius TaxID=280406 RepID=A0AAV2A1J2_9ARAC